MTPAQQTTLEALAGRSLTSEEIAAIDVPLAIRNDVAIAALLPPREQPRQTEIGVGTILATFGAVGGEFLDLLSAIGAQDRNIYWLLQGTIMRGVFDASTPASRAGLAALRAGVDAKFHAGIDALLALGVQQVAITTNEVSDALREA